MVEPWYRKYTLIRVMVIPSSANSWNKSWKRSASWRISGIKLMIRYQNHSLGHYSVGSFLEIYEIRSRNSLSSSIPINPAEMGACRPITQEAIWDSKVV